MVPCIPKEWTGFKPHYRYRETTYHTAVLQLRSRDGEAGVTVDGEKQTELAVSLVDDRKEHSVEVRVQAMIDATTASFVAPADGRAD